ncbi:MAG: acyl-CoA reductase, partial [Polaromonas sp.]|nr:acyl-CoA reductase [Polaromonas sp.]
MITLHAVAGYLPGFRAEELAWQTLHFEGAGERLEVAVPELSPAQWVALAERVKQGSRAYLKTRTVSHIIAVVDRVVARLLNPADPCRQQAD